MRYNSVRTRGERFKQAPATQMSASLPASVGGINALDSLANMAPTDCLYTYNLMPSEYGVRLRQGYREWANGMTGGSVNTIISFEGQDDIAGSPRLWAVTADGIWNVTTFGETAPTQEVPNTLPPPDNAPWTNVTGGAGFGNWTEMGNDAGTRFLFYADNENGLYRYREDTDIWEVPVLTGGIVAADVAYVVVWKQRLWLVERDSGDAWYLEPSAIEGAATRFNFGTKLRHGGELKALFNWTIDGGEGVDDILVAVGRGGDVLGYQGLDPAAAEGINLVASYFVGEFPRSRNVGLDYGGELYLLSTYGIISVRQLLQGVEYDQPGQGPSRKINRFLRDAVAAGKDSYVWSMSIYPRDGFIQLTAPFDPANKNGAIQYLQNTMTEAWGMWRGVPAYCGDTWQERFIMGTPDGSVIEYAGGVDGTSLDPQDPLGTAIEYSILTSYQAPGGDGANYKKVGHVRPIQISGDNTNSNVKVLYDYDITTVIDAPASLPGTASAQWDNAQWDNAVWDYAASSSEFIRGTMGQGRVAAIAMRGTSTQRLTFVGWDVSYEIGGFL